MATRLGLPLATVRTRTAMGRLRDLLGPPGREVISPGTGCAFVTISPTAGSRA